MKKNLVLLAGVLFVITIATAFMIRLVPVPKENAASLAEEHFTERDKALSALETCRFSAAELSLSLVCRRWPRDRVASRLLIRLYFETGRLTEAEKLILQLLRESPDDGLLLNDLGCVYWARRNFGRAERLLKKAARQKQDSAGILLNLAAVMHSRQMTAEAQKYRNAASLLVLAGLSADTGELARIDRYRRGRNSSTEPLLGLPEAKSGFSPAAGGLLL